MAQLRIDIDPETYDRLAALAVAERRPIPWQAEMILKRALAPPAEPPYITSPSTNDGEQDPNHSVSRCL